MPQCLKDLLLYLPSWISAFFTVVIAVATVAYVWLTRRLWQETKKSADAATEAVRAAKDNALAAKQSASAAQSSAGAASESAALMRQQFYDQAERGRLTVEFTIDSAVNAIDHLKSQSLGEWAIVHALPPTVNLFPLTAGAVIEYACPISALLATKLSSAFDDLRIAFDQIERLRNLVSTPGVNSDALRPTAVKADQLLTSALRKFTEAKALIPLRT